MNRRPLCDTPRCAEHVRLNSERYTQVRAASDYERQQVCQDAQWACLSCGGFHAGGRWVHRCHQCRRQVAAGQLRAVGLSTPSVCQDCEAKIKRPNSVRCHRCGQPLVFCHC